MPACNVPNQKEICWTAAGLERIFPQLGVRFIAIHDGYDSLTGNAPGESNKEIAARLISEKIRLRDCVRIGNRFFSRFAYLKIRNYLECNRKFT